MPTALTRGQWRETPRALSAQTPTMGTDPPAADAPSPGRAGRGARAVPLFVAATPTRSKRLHEKERGAKRTTTQTNFQHWGGKKHIAPGIPTNHPPTAAPDKLSWPPPPGAATWRYGPRDLHPAPSPRRDAAWRIISLPSSPSSSSPSSSPSLLSSSFLPSPPRPPSEIVVVARSGGGAAVCERPPPLNGFSHGAERSGRRRERERPTDGRASQRHTNILLCAVELKPHTVRDAYREIGLGAHPTSTS